MNLALAALVLLFPLLAQAQQLEPPYQLDPGESPPATVAPTPTPSPTPSPTSGTWPAADGSGVGVRHPDCPTTTPPLYSGPTTITVAGTRIFNATINSQLTIRADNVTVECVVIKATGAQRGIAVGSSGNPAKNTKISKVKISSVGDPSTLQGKCIFFSGQATNLRVEFSDLSDCEDGIHAEGRGAEIVSNFIHGLKDFSGLHSDGITVASGANYLIKNNRFDGFTNISSSIMVQPAGSCPVMDNIDIVENFINNDGNGHTILSDRSVGCSCPTGMDILNNRFGPKVVTAVGNGSGDKACPPVTQRGGSCSGNQRFDGSAVGC